MTEEQKDDSIAVLLRVRKAWLPTEGMQVSHKTGSFVQATVSKAALAVLQKDANVLNCEPERTLGRFK